MSDSNDRVEQAAQHAQVVPLHAATGSTAKDAKEARARRGPGRPRKTEPKPTKSDLEYHAETIKRKAEHVEKDAVVKAADKRENAAEVLRRIQAEVAREAAALEFDRIEQSKYGKDTASVSKARISALKEVANLELELKRLSSSVIDLKSEQMQKVFGLWIGMIQEAAAVLPAEVADVFFNKLTSLTNGWEEKAANELR
jgi:hypothetical protein